MQTCTELLQQHGSKAAAARFLGIAPSTFKDRLEAESRGARLRANTVQNRSNTSQGTIFGNNPNAHLTAASMINGHDKDMDAERGGSRQINGAIVKNRANTGNDFVQSPHMFTLREQAQKLNKPRTHCLIPDVQAKPGVPLDHLKWAGEYIAEKRPDVIVQIGDFADFPSLSSYDRHKKAAENKRYKYDLEAAHQAMELLMTPILKDPTYKPRLVLTLGNHEDRVTRFVDDNPMLEHSLSLADLGYEAWGWEVIPFRQPIEIDGVSYAHFFHPQNTDKPYAGANLQTRLQAIGFSFSMGHQQGLRTAVRDLSNGTRQRGLVAGSFYQHSETYRGPQASHEWRGIIMKHEVRQGDYDLMEVSLNFLRRRYG